ncbi:MAG: hypothetical protein P4L51_20380 [Puia sp.]|nr:hypothetical protein [Puia sp.]
MIQALSNRFRRPIALALSLVIYLQFLMPLYARAADRPVYHAVRNSLALAAREERSGAGHYPASSTSSASRVPQAIRSWGGKVVRDNPAPNLAVSAPAVSKGTAAASVAAPLVRTLPNGMQLPGNSQVFNGYDRVGNNKPFGGSEAADGIRLPNSYQPAAGKNLSGGQSAGTNRLPVSGANRLPAGKKDIGGPSSPEASSFKSVGTDNLVNLFTGDFNYSVPLLDVDGYPVNLFYNGGIGMEQEASWVGLGWNINPGSVSRNMRGVPDDFDGTDQLLQQQATKPNRTWGGVVGADGEVIGFKSPPSMNFSLGFSYNNYLGPELDLGAGVSVSIPIAQTLVSEKSAPLDTVQGLSLSFGLNAKLSSRSGLTLSPSLNANMHWVSQHLDIGTGISTSYNSRTGIKDLNISSQTSSYSQSDKYKGVTAEQARKMTGPILVHGGSVGLYEHTISFARPSYMPTLRAPMQNSYTSGQLELGAGMFGLRGAGTLQGYYTVSKLAEGADFMYKPMVGFLYLEKAAGNKNAIMDFNRLNDGEVTPNTPIISAPQYDYDIFTIQGEGTGGSIRAYRGDLGFMRDHETDSKDNSLSIGFDIAPAGHYGGNLNTVNAPTKSGNWDDNNNTLNQTLVFNGRQSGNSFEHYYFRNPGETTVTNDKMIDSIGRDNLVRFLLDGSSVTPRLESQLEQFSKKTGAVLGTIPIRTVNQKFETSTVNQRDKRSQVVTMLTAADASQVGLDKVLESYHPELDGNNNLVCDSIQRVSSYRQAHHISEITVLETSGMRYVYGLPVYNTTQQDFTFSVRNTPADTYGNLVNFNSAEAGTNSPDVADNSPVDGYVSEQTTPAYASSFLITGLLSPDYVDVTGNGITEDDLGKAVKFDYTMSSGLHQWRTPRDNANINTAHFNIGLHTVTKDDKATISYGEREAWYLHAIESKSMIALFYTSNREDAKGVMASLDGQVNGSENVNKKLDSIALYTKADIKAHGLSGAIPIKTVHFDYNYSLCKGSPDNPIATQGKLTLADIYYTFNGQSRLSKDMYVFNYGDTTSSADNAPYAVNASDRWGTYKPAKDPSGNTVNPVGLNNIDYPYTLTNKTLDDQYAGTWSLKKILLPSGGQLEVSYEADDYAYVQNRRACNMYTLYGLGSGTSYSQNNMLYSVIPESDMDYVYIQLPTALQNSDPVKARQEIFTKYLDGLNQLAFKIFIAMPKGLEPLTIYGTPVDYGLCPNSTDQTIIYVKLNRVNGKGALANASVQFLINQLPGQAFSGYDMSGQSGLSAFLGLITSALGSLATPFKNAEQQVKSSGLGSTVALPLSFVRLAAPTFFKYGGGHRVKRVLLRDNWAVMKNSSDGASGQYTSTYGQDYDYTTTQMVNGVSTTISSGVASYEPGIGSEENPFREILQFEDKLPLASAQYGAIEMPTLEGLYPSPVVGYSKVTVRSIHRNGTHGDSVVRSAIGKQVSEFYTARDYPTYSTYTPMSNIDYHHNPAFTFLYKETIDRRTTSQGFLVETNDMHGKIKQQAVYSESDQTNPLSYTIHYYKNTGMNGLNDQVDFVHGDQSGTVSSGNMGVDMELMTDVREFSIVSNGSDVQAQTDFFTFVPWPIFGIFIYPLASYTENKYRAVTTTKLINYHAIEDSVIVNDKGSTVTTKNIAYDAETGMPLVSTTRNEFNDPVYTTTYPAYWAYSGTAPAYKNIGMHYDGVTVMSGQITAGVPDPTQLESGDELYVTYQGTAPSGPCASLASGAVSRLWVFDTSKNTTALTVPSVNRHLMILDSSGTPYTKAGVSFTIIRSGRRNELSLTAGSATSMLNPIQTVSGTRTLLVNSSSNVVAASAAAYKEKWQTDADEIPKTTVTVVNCVKVETPDCNGTLPNHINPYTKGLVGNLRPYRSYVYYGSRAETDPTVNTTIRKNGYIAGFGNFWSFDVNSNLVPDYTNTNWVWNNELTKVNSRGQELETRDALNRYTSAQYGFAKNFPVAMVQNSRYGLSFDEGFEDSSYSESLNNAVLNECNGYQYINFKGLANSSIINADTLSFHAHSGKYALRVNPNSQAVLPLAVKPNLLDTFHFNWKQDTTLVLSQPGGNIGSVVVSPNFANGAGSGSAGATYVTGQGTFSGGGYNSGTIASANSSAINSSGNGLNWAHTFSYTVSYYIQISASNSYTFALGASSNGNGLGTTDESDLNFTITDLSGNTVGHYYLSSSAATSYDYSVNLCAGIYQVQAYISDGFSTSTGLGVNQISSTNVYSISIVGTSLTDYQTATTVSGCIYTLPLAATDSMLNSRFRLVPGANMQFSGWVREDCGNPAGTLCSQTNYTQDHVTIKFPGSASPSINLYPRGTIIEGWQRIDTSFTVPSDADTADLVLSADGSQNVYFDDLRIHPFNADMKSYVYDPRTLRLMAQLDENNYATFYNYDEEGQLVRIKQETVQGVKTIKEVRTAKQKSITTVQ